MKILFFGDIHDDLDSIKLIQKQEQADKAIITGDLTRYGGEPEAVKVIEVSKGISSNILAVVGNMDKKEIDEYLSKIKINIHSKGIKLNSDLGIFGSGGSIPTPFHTPTEIPEQEYTSILEKGYNDIKDCRTKILVSHQPPFDTSVDKINMGMHVGSKVLRDFILECKPDLCVCGHIHEAQGTDYLGETKIINTGISAKGYVCVEYDQKILSAELILIS